MNCSVVLTRPLLAGVVVALALPHQHLSSAGAGEKLTRSVPLAPAPNEAERGLAAAFRNNFNDDYCPVPLSVTSSGLKVLP